MTSDVSLAGFTHCFPNPTETKENLNVVREFDSSINKAFEHFTPLLSDEFVGMPLVRELLEELRTLFHDLIGVLEHIVEDSEAICNMVPLFKLDAESDVSGSGLATEIKSFLENSKEVASTRQQQLEKITCGILRIEDRCTSMKIEAEIQKINMNKSRGRPKTTTLFVVVLAYFTKNSKSDRTTEAEAEQKKYLATLSNVEAKLHCIWEELDTGCSGWWQLLGLRFGKIMEDVEWLGNMNENPATSYGWLACRRRLISLKDTADAFGRILSEVLGDAPSFPLLSSRDLDRDHTLSGYLQVFEKHVKDLPIVTAKLKTAEQILRQPHDIDFRRQMHELNRCMHDELKAIRVVFKAWSFRLDQGFPGTVSNYRGITEMEQMNHSFSDLATQHKMNIANLFTEKRISRSKSKIVKSKQKQVAINGLAAITQATIATGQEALGELERLGTILVGFENFSTEFGRALRNPGPTVTSTSENVSPPKDAYSVDAKLARRILSTLSFQIAGLTNAIRLNS